MADDNEINGDDVGWWSCSLCTYKNSAEKFKCEICDLRRGTSTRKPRCSADTIVAQVVKQQEQIRQQTKVKPTPKSKSSGTGSRDSQNAAASNNNDSMGTSGASGRSSKKSSSRRKKSKNSRKRRLSDSESSDEEDINEGAGAESTSDEETTHDRLSEERKLDAKRNRRKKLAKSKDSAAKRPKKSKKLANTSANPDDSETGTSDATEDSSTYLEMGSATPLSSQSSGPHLRMMSGSPDSSQSSEHNLRMMSATPDSLSSLEPSTSSPPPDHQSPATLNGGGHATKDNPFKIRPIELNGNLIKYLPPTSTGRTGLIIDKKRFTQHSVTVDDVTITFTEFATRQNNYIRKSKKKSSKSSSRPSTTGKIQPKTGSSHSNNNSPLPTPARTHDRANVTDD